MHVAPRRKRFTPAQQSTLRVLACGCVDHREFAEAFELIRGTGELFTCDSPEALVGRACNSPHRYDLLLACTSRPGVLPIDLSHKLKRYAPLVGRAQLLGSWCEGEERTGHTWNGVERVFWHRFELWWQENLRRFDAGVPPSWIRKPTAPAPIEVTGNILVCSHGESMTRTLMSIVKRSGANPIGIGIGQRLPLVTNLHSAVWVGSQLVGEEAKQLAAFATAMRRRRVDSIVAIADFPRYETAMWARSIGVRVLGKPWHNSELLSALATPLESAEGRPRRLAA